ncbi:MAG TPA: hypothetical protein VLA44_10680 [Clostridia bacterium]|nr:hypothetical protein [Clostridia bacterium]
MTLEDPGRGPRHLPPDPGRYDSPRAQRAREKGLEAPYISGGEAPDAADARAEERRLGRILLIMVLVIISAGFVLGAVVALFAPAVQ